MEEQAGGRSRLVQLWVDSSMERFEAGQQPQEFVSAG
jgi:hypothetical protein